jgi:hypothetical protein
MTTTTPSSAPTEAPAAPPEASAPLVTAGPSSPTPPVRDDGRRRLALIAVAVLAALLVGRVAGDLLAMRAEDAPAPPPAPAPYAPALKTASAEDQRRFLAEAASEHFVRVWQQPGSEAERLAALAPLMTPGSATRPAADTSPPSAELCCAPEVIQADERGALWLTRLSDGSTVEIRGIFTAEGQFLVADVQG